MTLTQVDAALASKILPFLNLTYSLANDDSLIEDILDLCSGSRQEPIAVQEGSPMALFLDAFIPTLPNSHRGFHVANRNRRPCQPCAKKHQGCKIVSSPGQPRLCLKCKERGLSLCPSKMAGTFYTPDQLEIPGSGREAMTETASSSGDPVQFIFRLDDSPFPMEPF